MWQRFHMMLRRREQDEERELVGIERVFLTGSLEVLLRSHKGENKKKKCRPGISLLKRNSLSSVPSPIS